MCLYVCFVHKPDRRCPGIKNRLQASWQSAGSALKKTAVEAPAAATPSARQPLVIARLHQELGSFIVGNLRVTLPKNMKEFEPDEAVLLLLELKDAGTPITLVMKAMHWRAYHAGGLACIGAVEMQV